MQNHIKEKIMLGSFYGKLDKGTSLICLGLISLIVLGVLQTDLLSAFNICGVFKQ